jgi:hypothetical protein
MTWGCAKSLCREATEICRLNKQHTWKQLGRDIRNGVGPGFLRFDTDPVAVGPKIGTQKMLSVTVLQYVSDMYIS